MIYLLLRTYISNLSHPSREAPRDNKDVSQRLDWILAQRQREQREEEEDEYDEDGEGEGHDYSASSETDSEACDGKSYTRIRTRRRQRDHSPQKPLYSTLDSYEQSIASEVVHPSSIPVTFADIGGLDNLISDLQESVIYPLTLPQLYRHSSSLVSAPSGVLLYGPPGCGKTMLAKALAHESGAVFINLHISTLTEKWYGDSNKLVSAVFSLARKLAPAIVFIDEIDALLGTRRSGEHEASGMVKAEFMTHWDGLASSQQGSRTPQRILILGATNRMQDIDEAILRRMPKKFHIGLPDAEQRSRIFSLILRDARVDTAGFDMDALVRASAGLSGSDIRESCREAAMAPVREFIQSRKAKGQSMKGMNAHDMRGLRTEDFYSRLRPSGARRIGASSGPSGPMAGQSKAILEDGVDDVDIDSDDDDAGYETVSENESPRKSAPRERSGRKSRRGRSKVSKETLDAS